MPEKLSEALFPLEACLRDRANFEHRAIDEYKKQGPHHAHKRGRPQEKPQSGQACNTSPAERSSTEEHKRLKRINLAIAQYLQRGAQAAPLQRKTRPMSKA